MARRIINRSFAPVPQSLRRKTEWIASADTTGNIALGANSVILDQSFSQAQNQAIGPFTIVRTRGILWVGTDQIAANEQPFGAMGMMVVREPARVAGIGSLPTPITDEFDDGFFVYQYWGNMFELNAGASAVVHFDRYEFDSKAQRKVNSDDAIVVTLENASALHGAVYVLKFRMLLKLS